MTRNIHIDSLKARAIFVALCVALPIASFAQANSLFAAALTGASNQDPSNTNGPNWDVNNAVYDSTLVTAHESKSFTGMDGAGNTQTMSFTGATTAQANYGQLHVYTTATVNNSYYNANNSLYYQNNTVNPAGSPTNLSSLGFATFNDTLQYGGALQAGYQARYIFELVGTASGTGVLADLGVTIAGNPTEAFFEGGTGNIADTWATKSYAINGTDPQTIGVQFSDQVIFNTPDLTDGSNVTGTDNFQDTLNFVGIQILDSNGNMVSGVTVTSASGTNYAINPAPEPAPLIALASATALLLLRKVRHS